MGREHVQKKGNFKDSKSLATPKDMDLELNFKKLLDSLAQEVCKDSLLPWWGNCEVTSGSFPWPTKTQTALAAYGKVHPHLSMDWFCWENSIRKTCFPNELMRFHLPSGT